MKNLIKQYRMLALPVRAAIWFTVCNFTLKGMNLICMPLYARMMSTSEYGRASVLMSYDSIFLVFATFELSLGAFQRGILKFKEDLDTFEQSIVILSNAITLLFFCVVMSFWSLFSQYTGMSFLLFGLMAASFLVSTPYNCWLNRVRFFYSYKRAVALTLAMTFAANILPLVTLHYLGKTAEVKVASTFIITILFSLPFWLRHWNLGNIKKNIVNVKKYVKYALIFQSPLVFHSLSYYLLNQSDRVMIDWFVGDSSKVAYYSVAYSLASVIIIFQNSLNQVLKPWRFKKLEAGAYRDVRQMSNLLIIMISAIIVLFALLVPDVLRLAFPSEYYEAVYCMAPIAFGVFFLFLYTIFVDIESYYGKTKYIAFVSVICAVLNVGLNYIGLQGFGFDYTVCAYTTLLCYIIMAILHYCFMRKTCREAGVSKSLVDTKFLFASCGAVFMLFIIVLFSYRFSLLRYAMCLCILIVAVTQRKRFKAVICNLQQSK